MNWQDSSYVSFRWKKKKEKTFYERAWQLILNNREKMIRQIEIKSICILLSFFQFDDALRGSIDEERNRWVFGNQWQDRSGIQNQRLGHSAFTKEEKEQRTQ